MTNSITDIGESKCVFVLGSNTFETTRSSAGDARPGKRGGKVIVADPG